MKYGNGKHSRYAGIQWGVHSDWAIGYAVGVKQRGVSGFRRRHGLPKGPPPRHKLKLWKHAEEVRAMLEKRKTFVFIAAKLGVEKRAVRLFVRLSGIIRPLTPAQRRRIREDAEEADLPRRISEARLQKIAGRKLA